MRKPIKLYLSVICICIGVLLTIGSAILIIGSEYVDNVAMNRRADVLSQLHASMPKTEISGRYFNIFPESSLSIGGVDYVGILAIPSIDMEMPISAEYDKSGVSIYRISGDDLPVALSCNSKSWSAAADASVGDVVIVTDMRGFYCEYTVTDIERKSSYDSPADVQSDDMLLTLVIASKGAYVILGCEAD